MYRRLLQRLLALALPQDCVLCGLAVAAQEGIPAADLAVCPTCAASLPRLPAAHCPICALPTTDAQVCGACLHKPPHFEASHAPFVYAFPLDRLIQSLKYQHRLVLCDWFGHALTETCMAAGLTTDTAPPDFILPMPLHPRRLAARGFNQAMELARGLARATAWPLQPEIISRALNVVPQASLPWKERQRNIRGAFLCHQDLSGCHILVVDDVMTTGASLNELAACLKHRGAARVTNLVLARTLPGQGQRSL